MEDSASADELNVFSPEFDTLMLDISKRLYTRRVSALIAQWKDRDIMEGFSSSLVLIAGLLHQCLKCAQSLASKLEEMETSKNNLSREKDQAIFALELE